MFNLYFKQYKYLSNVEFLATVKNIVSFFLYKNLADRYLIRCPDNLVPHKWVPRQFGTKNELYFNT